MILQDRLIGISDQKFVKHIKITFNTAIFSTINVYLAQLNLMWH